MTAHELTATGVIPVTPNDDADLPNGPCWSLMIGTAGDIKVTDLAGNTNVIPGVPAGEFPVKVKRVWNTGTTAQNIAAFYQ